MTLLLVVIGGMVGAPARFLTDRALRSRAPLGTFLVNVAGSLLLGALAGAGPALPGELKTLVGTGFCGALTTYSTMSYETLRLVEEGRHARAAGYVASSLVFGIGAAAAGFALARSL